MISIRTVNATRYVTPLKEGGSLPAIVEADDDGLYVLKFRGAGQGPKALIAELISGELGRAAGLRIPEQVFINLDPDLARTEPDPEIQDLIRASGGLNFALDYLPGSIGFNTMSYKVDRKLASLIVWFDAFITNIDRTSRNPNLLIWYKNLWLIDHGASLYFHHTWSDYLNRSKDAFPFIKDHVLLSYADSLEEADIKMKQHITEDLIKNITDLIPDTWLEGNKIFNSIEKNRNAYNEYLMKRLQHSQIFLEEAIHARSSYI